MKILKKIFRIIGRLLLGLLAFILLYVLSAFALSRITVNKDAIAGNITIYVRTNGVHTDVIVPAKTLTKDWTSLVLYEHFDTDEKPEYLAFGWGDRDFYLNTPTWADLKFKTAFNAAFYLGSTVVHAEYLNEPSESETCRKISITQEDFEKLTTYLSDTFKTESGDVIWISGSGYGDSDTFYAANGRYSLFKTCNTWTNSALKAANQKAAFWTATDGGVLIHHR